MSFLRFALCDKEEGTQRRNKYVLCQRFVPSIGNIDNILSRTNPFVCSLAYFDIKSILRRKNRQFLKKKSCSCLITFCYGPYNVRKYGKKHLKFRILFSTAKSARSAQRVKKDTKNYRVSHSEVWQVIWVWQIEICKLEFVWRLFWNPEAGTF